MSYHACSSPSVIKTECNKHYVPVKLFVHGRQEKSSQGRLATRRCDVTLWPGCITPPHLYIPNRCLLLHSRLSAEHLRCAWSQLLVYIGGLHFQTNTSYRCPLLEEWTETLRQDMCMQSHPFHCPTQRNPQSGSIKTYFIHRLILTTERGREGLSFRVTSQLAHIRPIKKWGIHENWHKLLHRARLMGEVLRSCA